MSSRRRSSLLYQSSGANTPSREDSKKTSLSDVKSETSESHEDLLARINSQSTLCDEISQGDQIHQTTLELNFYYGIVKRHLLRYQSPTTGLFPATSADKKVGSIRDSIYGCMATWSLHQAYKKINNDQGKCYELGQSTVLGLQGILSCWMRQSNRLEAFKKNQSPENALHVKFDLCTGFEVVSTNEYGHLQLDVVSLYLLFLVQAIASGLQVVGSKHEVAFIQNLAFYVERAYRTPDFGMWERGSVYNDGTSEVHASSIGLAKAALEAINGFNLFGENGASWSVVYVDIDAHNRNRSIFETLLPRESASKEADAALLFSISFPAFATHDGEIYAKCKANILNHLQGSWGFKRFSRDGFGCVLEPKDQHHYVNGMTQKFEGVESEWPIFHAMMIIDGVFKNLDNQVDTHQRALKRLIKYTEKGDPILPMHYFVPMDAIPDEKANAGSQYRYPSTEGSSASNIFIWGQSMMLMADLLTSQLISVTDLDPIRRHLPSATRPKTGGRYSTFEVRNRFSDF